MGELDYWRLCERLSLRQAALLTVGVNPDKYEKLVKSDTENQLVGYEAAIAALVNAVKCKTLDADIVYWREIASSRFDYVDPNEIALDETTVSVIDLKSFLSDRGVTTGFFFPDAIEGPGYLNPNHPHYSAGLAAAVKASLAVTADEGLRRGRTPKQAVEKWLRDNLDQLVLPDGEQLSEAAIENISKIANWMTKGGAPKAAARVQVP